MVIRRGELRSFVESVVAPYRVAAEDPELPRLVELADAEASASAHAGHPHHSAFQALESGPGGRCFIWVRYHGDRQPTADLSGGRLRGTRADLGAADICGKAAACGACWWKRPAGTGGA